MDILEQIIANKRIEVKEKSELYPTKLLERSIFFNAQPVSLSRYIQREDLSGIIAEFKRKSPSKGMINEYAKPENVCLKYMRAGASALSVLTDTKYFGGNNEDLSTARKFNFCPILRKDFIISEYQIIEARSIGADSILLIAEILSAKELKGLSSLAYSLGLEVLFEVHDKDSITKLPADAKIVGINSRNLRDFSINQEHSVNLINSLPKQTIKIAESGVDSPEMLIKLKKEGFDGFLIGERFMRDPNPGKACEQFIARVKEIEIK